MYSERVDGPDVLAVRDAMRRAAKIAREQHEPSLLEAVSFRFRGHSVVDPDRYRNPEEVKAGLANDPITTFPARLNAPGLVASLALPRIDHHPNPPAPPPLPLPPHTPSPPPPHPLPST